MQRFKTIFLVFSLYVFAFAAGSFTTISAAAPASLVDQQADSLLANHKFVYIDNVGSAPTANLDSLEQVISEFYYNQFRHFSDPAAPYFLFLSKDSQLMMGIGGQVVVRGYYEWGGALENIGFSPYMIPMNPSPTDMRHFDMSAASSGLFFTVLGHNKTLGKFQVYIEGQFSGYQNQDFKLKKAYATIRNVTIGYASSTFSDPSALPPTVDDAGPNIKMTPKRVLLRYMKSLKGGVTLAVSAENTSNQIAADNALTQTVSNSIPDAAAFVQYGWRKAEHVRLSAIVRQLGYRDLKLSKNHYVAGWGLQASAVTHPIPQLTNYTVVSYGRGYASLGGDLSNGNYDLIPNPEEPGLMYAPASWGYCIGLQYNFRPNLFSSIAFSQNRFLPSKPIAGNEYKYGLYGAVNVFWNITPRMQVGAEFDLGKRNDFDHRSRSAKRMVAMAQFSF